MFGDLYPLPLLAPHDYDSFRGLNDSDLPDTYDEWLKLHLKEKLERGRVGYIIREIPVNPDEFSRFCRANGIAPDGLALLKFAIEEFRRNKD